MKTLADIIFDLLRMRYGQRFKSNRIEPINIRKNDDDLWECDVYDLDLQLIVAIEQSWEEANNHNVVESSIRQKKTLSELKLNELALHNGLGYIYYCEHFDESKLKQCVKEIFMDVFCKYDQKVLEESFKEINIPEILEYLYTGYSLKRYKYSSTMLSVNITFVIKK